MPAPTPTPDGLLDAVRSLLRMGLPLSARAILDAYPGHGRARNELAAQAIADVPGRLERRIHALVVLKKTEAGLALPLEAIPGIPPSGFDAAALEAIRAARRAALAMLGLDDANVPDHTYRTPELPALEGASLGLGVGLALLSALSARAPLRPVLSTGRLGTGGEIMPVGCMKAKLDAARDLRGADGGEAVLLLVPPGTDQALCAGLDPVEVSTLDDAARVVFGDEPLRTDSTRLSLTEALAQAQKEGREERYREALRILGAWENVGSLTNADRSQLYREMGTQTRHLGRNHRARILHDKARDFGRQAEEAGDLSRSDAEKLDIEFFATELDWYDYEYLTQRLDEYLSGSSSFARLETEIECRGMLAQVHSSLGDHERALEIRQKNLARQQRSDALRASIPQTLCNLVTLAARVGNDALFTGEAEELVRSASGATKQPGYNDLAITRGLVLLRRFEDAVRWMEGAPLFGRRPEQRTDVDPTSKVSEHPGVSTVRAQIRALRKLPDPHRAVALSSRLDPTSADPLVRWLALAAQAEGALALFDLGNVGQARSRLHDLADQMESAEPRISGFHRGLLKTMRARDAVALDVSAVEARLDEIYY